MKIKTKDDTVKRVIQMLDQRSEKGFDTYGITLTDDNTRNIKQWLTMLQEEVLDAANYIEKLKSLFPDAIDDVNELEIIGYCYTYPDFAPDYTLNGWYDLALEYTRECKPEYNDNIDYAYWVRDVMLKHFKNEG